MAGEGEWKPMPGYPPEFKFDGVFEPFVPQRYGKPLVTTQRGWANMLLPVNDWFMANLVAEANEVLRHCRVGKVTFKDAQNHSRK